MSAQDPSKENLINAWLAVQKKLAPHHRASATSVPFREYAWDTFDPAIAISILLDPQSGFFAQKRCVLAAFCAWVLAPTSRAIRRSAIVTSAATALAEAEGWATKKYDDIPQVGDIYVRTVLVAPDFFNQIYYPMGGIRSLIYSRSTQSLKKSIERRRSHIYNVNSLLHIYHYVADCLDDDTHLKPAKERAADNVSYLKKKTSSAREVDKSWVVQAASSAFLYAAYNTMIDEKSSILELLLEDFTKLRLIRPVMCQWINNAHYILNGVLSKVAMPEKHFWLSPDMGGVRGASFSPRPLPANVEAFIEQAFRKP